MDSMHFPLLAAVCDEDYLIAHDTFYEKNPAKFAFMFTSKEAFNRFAESERENRGKLRPFQLQELGYQSLLVHLRRAINEAGIDFIIIDYVYENSPKLNHLYNLFDAKDAANRLSSWGEKTKWGEETETTPGTDKPPYPRAERLTGMY